MLATYRGVVEGGKVRLQDAVLPEGAEVVVVALERNYPPVDAQAQRLAKLVAEGPEEWHKPFDAIRRAWEASEPAELEGQPLAEDELNVLIEQVREEVYAEGRRRSD